MKIHVTRTHPDPQAPGQFSRTFEVVGSGRTEWEVRDTEGELEWGEIIHLPTDAQMAAAGYAQTTQITEP